MSLDAAYSVLNIFLIPKTEFRTEFKISVF